MKVFNEDIKSCLYHNLRNKMEVFEIQAIINNNLNVICFCGKSGNSDQILSAYTEITKAYKYQ